MTLFYFDFQVGDEPLVRDDTGTSFKSLAHAKTNAMRTLAAIAAEMVPEEIPATASVSIRTEGRVCGDVRMSIEFHERH